jgi:fermentation-respiration switch protein FrsA (DUF1100 family)
MHKRLEFWIGTERLVGDLHLPDGLTGAFPCVITSHGYKSNRNSGKYTQIGSRFPAEGIAVFRFDHRGTLNGESDGKFEDMTLSRRIEDLLAAIDILGQDPEIDARRLGLLGSSLGGVDVLLSGRDTVKAKVIMATPAAFPPPSEEMKPAFKEKGYYQYPDGTRIKPEFYQDIHRYDIKEEAKKNTCPLLVIQGDRDELVPHHHAEVLYQACGAQIKKFIMVEGGDHAFSDSGKLNEVLDYTLNWFKKYL